MKILDESVTLWRVIKSYHFGDEKNDVHDLQQPR